LTAGTDHSIIVILLSVIAGCGGEIMREKLEVVIWFLVENVPSLLTIAFAAYVLVQSQRATLQVMEVLLWLLGIVGLLATSELVERFRRLRRIEVASLKTLDAIQAMSAPDVESVLQDRRAGIDWAKKASQAREILACGYSLINLVSAYEGFFVKRLEDGCNFRFLLLKPECDATHMLDGLVTSKPGELSEDIRSVLARLDRIRASANSATSGRLEIRLLKTVPTFSLVIVDAGRPYGWVQVEPYPSYYGVALDVGRPHFSLTQIQGRWYKFFCDQFQRLWDDPVYSEPYLPEA